MIDICELPDLIKDKFDTLEGQQREDAIALAGWCVYRDAKQNPDGSRGTVALTPKQLRDLIAYTMTRS